MFDVDDFKDAEYFIFSDVRPSPYEIDEFFFLQYPTTRHFRHFFVFLNIFILRKLKQTND